MVNPLALFGAAMVFLGVAKIQEKQAHSVAASSDTLAELQAKLEAATNRASELEAETADTAKLRVEISEARAAEEDARNKLAAFEAGEEARRKRPPKKDPAKPPENS